MQSQAENGETVYYLMQRGGFFHAYGCGAFALARVTGFRVLRKRRKAGEVLTTGFPVASLPKVRELLYAAGASVEERSQQLLLFGGIDGTPDESMVSQARTPASKAAVEHGGWGKAQAIIDDLLNFNLMQSTPPGGDELFGEPEGVGLMI